MPSSQILDILESKDGQILVATKDVGLVIFNEDADSFFRVDWPTYENLKTDRISSVFIDSIDQIWLGYESGEVLVFSVKTGFFKDRIEISNDKVSGFSEPTPGRIIASDASGNIYSINGKSEIQIVFESSKLCPGFISRVDEVSNGPDSNIWLGTKNDGLFLLDTENLSCKQIQFTENNVDIAESDIHDIYYDKNLEFTLVASDKGLFKIERDYQTSFYRGYGRDESESEITSISPGQNSTFWIGTYTGLSFLAPTVFETFNRKYNEDIRAVIGFDTAPSIGILIATYRQIIGFNPQTASHFLLSKNYPHFSFENDKIMAMHVDANGIWLGYRSSGLEYISFDANAHFKLGTDSKPTLSSDSISSILSINNEKVLIGTYGGGLNIISKNGTVKSVNVADNHVIMLKQTSDKIIWIGTESGLFILDTFSNEVEEFFLQDNAETLISKPIVWDMLEAKDGGLWFATMHHGLFYLSPQRNLYAKDGITQSKIFQFKQYSTVYAIEEDNNENIWASTNSGIITLRPKEKTFYSYSQTQGLNIVDFDFSVSYKDLNGYLYFGGNEGYIRFDPSKPSINPNIPKMFFQRVDISGNTKNVYSITNELPSLILTHKDRYVTFQFAVLDFLNPEKNQYRYMLEGFDENWVENGSRNSATYTNLPAGKYVLKVQGANSAGVWNREGLSLGVTVHPAPWFTWWAYCFYILLGFLALWVIKRAYDSFVVRKRATAMALEMNLEAERAEDELQEQLEIQDQLVKSVSRHNVATLKLVADFISTQSGLSREWASGKGAIDSINRVKALIALESCVYHHNEYLLADLNKYTDIIISELLCEASQSPESIATINEVSDQPFPLGQASLLAILLYELLENAIVHAFPDQRVVNYLHVQFSADKSDHEARKCYRLTVQDDGVGMPENFDPINPGSSGMAVAKSLADQLGGTLSVVSNGGTRISLVFPVEDQDVRFN